MTEQLTEFQKNKLFRQFNELRLQQKKATEALDSLRINKNEMLTQMTMSEYLGCEDNARWLYQEATNRLDKGLLKLIEKHPELETEVYPYFNRQHTTLH